jgi:hypothetical protein
MEENDKKTETGETTPETTGRQVDTKRVRKINVPNWLLYTSNLFFAGCAIGLLALDKDITDGVKEIYKGSKESVSSTRVMQQTDDFYFNSDVSIEPGNYKTEKDSLSSIVMESDSTPSRNTHIDQLFNNSVMIAQITAKDIDAQALKSMKMDYIDLENLIMSAIFNQKKGKVNLEFNFAGNGFIIGNGGYIITSYHVIDEDRHRSLRKLLVIGQDKKVYPAEVLAYSRMYDIALLKADMPDQKSVSPIILDEKSLVEYEPIFVLTTLPSRNVGFQLEDEISLAEADKTKISNIISSGRFLDISTYSPIISPYGELLFSGVHIENYVRGGYSGSAAVDRYGRIIGIASRVSNGSCTHLSPASKVKGLVDFYIETLANKSMNALDAQILKESSRVSSPARR